MFNRKPVLVVRAKTIQGIFLNARVNVSLETIPRARTHSRSLSTAQEFFDAKLRNSA
jgi:hypothetical protein